MTTLPFTGKWKVAHGKDFFADLIRTKNLDFTKEGYVKLAKKTVALYTTDTDSDFGTPMVIIPISTGTSTIYYIITTGNMFSWDASTSAFTESTAGSAPTFGFDSDGVSYLGIPTVSGATVVKSYNSGSGVWTSRVTSLSTTYPHPVCVFENRNTLCTADGNIVYQTTTGAYSDDSSNRLTIPSEYVITSMRWRENNLYIGTRNIGGGESKLFIWNGAGTSAQYAYGVGALWIYSLVDYSSSITLLTSKGQLLRFNGGGFDELAHFPVFDTPYSWESSAALTNGTGRCANRGMIANGTRLNINIDGRLNVSLTDAPSRFLPDQPSGLWVYDPDIGLYHKAGYTHTRYSTPSYSFGSSHFDISSAHNMQTGDPVYFTVVSGLSGVTVSQLYYAIVDTTTGFYLAQSRADAVAGRHITITGVPTTDAFIIDVFDSVGAATTSTFPGCVAPFLTDNPPSILGSDLMFGANVTKADGTNIKVLMSLGSGHNVGYFVTSPIPAESTLDSFKALVQFIEDLKYDSDAVVVKYRTNLRYGFPTKYHSTTGGFASWTSSTTFTVDTTLKNVKGALVGDEVEIIEGAGAGYSAHITAIDDSSSTYTFTIDEAIPGISAGNKSEVSIDNWTRIPTNITASTITKRLAKKSFVAEATSIQFKIELRGIDIGIRRFFVNSVAAQLAA